MEAIIHAQVNRPVWPCLLYLYLVSTSSGLITKGDSITRDSYTGLEIQLQWLMIPSTMKVLYIPIICVLHLLELI